MTRQELFTWIRQQYGTEPEYPWHDWNAVLRHKDNNKWYGVMWEEVGINPGLPFEEKVRLYHMQMLG